MELLLSFFSMLIVGALIDVVWLSKVAKKFYGNNLGSILLKDKEGNTSFRLLPAALFYVIYITGILFLVIYPSNGDLSILNILRGSLLGFVCYATYDLTNYSTLKDFKLKVVIVDIIWGTLLTTIISIVGLIVY